MSQEVQNGKGVLWGMTNNGTPISIEGYASFLLESGKSGHKFKLDAIEDEIGFDAALVATNTMVEVDITWVPSAATRALAAATAVFLDPLSKVTMANFKATEFNGDWIYIGDETIDLSHGPAKMSMKLRKYSDETQNASLSTTVTG